MPQGVIKKIVSERGFGFITPDRSAGSGERRDIFFHFSAVEGVRFEELREGQAVQYEVSQEVDTERAKRGPRAASVKPV